MNGRCATSPTICCIGKSGKLSRTAMSSRPRLKPPTRPRMAPPQQQRHKPRPLRLPVEQTKTAPASLHQLRQRHTLPPPAPYLPRHRSRIPRLRLLPYRPKSPLSPSQNALPLSANWLDGWASASDLTLLLCGAINACPRTTKTRLNFVRLLHTHVIMELLKSVGG